MESVLDIRVGEAGFGELVLTPPWRFRVRPGPYALLYAPVGDGACVRFPDGDELTFADGSVLSLLGGREHVIGDCGASCRARPEDEIRLDDLAPIARAGALRPGNVRVVIARVPITSNPLPDVLPHAIYVPPEASDTHARLAAVFSAAIAFHDAPGTIRQPVLKRIAEIIAIELTEFALESGDAGWDSRIADARIRRAVSLMRVHPERRWTLSMLADAASMSRSAFAARFREVVGQTPLGYLHRLRMHHAGELIRTSSKPLYSIATQVGYASDTAFSKAFRREFACSPAAYRRDHAARG